MQHLYGVISRINNLLSDNAMKQCLLSDLSKDITELFFFGGGEGFVSIRLSILSVYPPVNTYKKTVYVRDLKCWVHTAE